MAITNKEQGVWSLDQVYNKQMEGDIWSYDGPSQLWTWGQNSDGGLGQNNTTNYSSPRQIPGTNWANASGSSPFSAGIKTDGTLWTWGQDAYGQLGQNGPHNINLSSPTQVGTDTTWSDVSTGTATVVATKTDKTLWVWGWNEYGQVGDNSKTQRSSPVQIGSDTDWNKVAGGMYRGWAIKTDGTLWGWGYNGYGRLGLNNTTRYSSPTQVGTDTTWSNITSGAYASAAVKTNGTLWTWGRNNYGALGQNEGPPGASVNSYSSPKQVGTNTDWSSVAMSNAGATYQTYALKTDGTLWGMGYGDLGALGQDNQVHYSSPVQIPGTAWSSIKAESMGGLMALKQF